MSQHQKVLELWMDPALTSGQVERKVKLAALQVDKLSRMTKPKPKVRNRQKPYVLDFMKFDKDFDWEKFKGKYEKTWNKTASEQTENKPKEEETDETPTTPEEGVTKSFS
jgi:hypothetical protein